ncbi:DUF1254 domain-containing protein [Catalinimonas sp. 4WD22]|uniref:DUF1254 domain-containing protein n=1 Tax=Catalinimonas locisalis TaxID=3133978 RepID=UPI003101283D
MVFTIKNLIAVVLILVASACSREPTLLGTKEIRALAKEAYLYGFPMVVNYRSMYLYSIDKNSPDYKGPFNQPGCEARLFTPEDKGVVTPNSDTPYCMGVIDVSSEPVVVSVPGVSKNRYYSLQLIDMYTHNFAYIGSLSTGIEASNYLIAGSQWQGDKPPEVDSVFRCESDYFLVIIRTQLFGPDDLENVEKLQEQYVFQPLSAFTNTQAPQKQPQIDWPVWNEGDQITPAGFKYLDFVLTLLPVHEDDAEIREKLMQLNIGNGKFDLSTYDEAQRQAMQEGIDDARAEVENMIKQTTSDPLASAKMFGTRSYLVQSAKENYGLETPYLIRTLAAQQGLYGNSKSEALYPFYSIDADREPLDGSKNNYTITFEEGAFPSVSAFWSFTMYEGRTQFLVENQIDRYLINSTMLKTFSYNADGSLTFYIQNDRPDAEKVSNWLPAPNGPFYCVMRLYGPDESVQNGNWNRPLIEKAD